MPRPLFRSLTLFSVIGPFAYLVGAGSAHSAEPDNESSKPGDIAATSGSSDLSALESAPSSGSRAAEPTIRLNPSPEDRSEQKPAAPRSSSRLVEEIIVTAQKREENLQDVPISINAFSAETLDARGISDPKDLPQATPGLTVGSSAGYTVTYLRGVGSDAFLLADPSVALYIDNVYFPFAHGAAQNFGSIERVEVLKGPQGTLFGRNAVGGAISIITQAPSFDAPSGSVTASYGSYNDLQTKAQLNIPLSDTFAIGVSGLYNASDNYRDGVSAGQPLPREVTKGARLKLRWAPIEAFDMTVAGFKLEQTGVSTMFATNADPIGAFKLLIPPQTGRDGVNDELDFFRLENTVLYGQATLFTDQFDVKLIGSHQDIETSARYDFDGSPVPLVFFGVPKQGANVKTAELQILSNQTSWASDRLTWIAGYYYYTGVSGLDRVEFGVGSPIFTSGNDVLTGILNPFLDSKNIPRLLPEDALAANGTLKTDSNSVFAQVTYAFTDWVSLTLGGRLQDEKRTLVSSGGAIDPPVGPDIPYTQFSGQSDTTKSLSPKLSLEFRPWDDGLIYTSYQQAVKSSTYNVVNFLRFIEPEPVKKEELTAYEIGIKKTVFNGSTTFSSAAFYYDLKNLQVQFISLLAGGAVTFENAPAARVRGIDFDVTSELFPDTLPGLVLTMGGAFLDAKFTDFPNGQGFGNDGIYSASNDFTGNRIPRSPKFSGTVGLSQTLDIAGGPLEVATDYYYNSGFYYLAENGSTFDEPSYGVLGARISYLYEPWALRTTVFGKNLTNEFYTYGKFSGDFGPLSAVAPPRTFGVRLSWDF